jgi:hypothetical protein
MSDLTNTVTIAQSLIPQIAKAHDELVAAETEGFSKSLRLAIKLGALLNVAKESVDNDQRYGNWKRWFEERKKNGEFKFSYRSSDRYRKFAKDQAKLEAALLSPRVARLAAEGQLSIRAAEALLKDEEPEEDQQEEQEQEDQEDQEEEQYSGEDGSASVEQGQGSADLTELMKNYGADEIKVSLKDAEKLNEVADLLVPPLEERIKNTSPQRLATILTNVWDAKQLQALADDLSTHLKRRSTLQAA